MSARGDGRSRMARDLRRVAMLRALDEIQQESGNERFADAAEDEFGRVLRLLIADAPENQQDTIPTAAQEPPGHHEAGREADRRGSDVEAPPVEAVSEKVEAGERTAIPRPSSEGGHIPGTAGSLAPCAFPISDGAGWRLARVELRRAGHDVQQHEGIVYVDGFPSSDPRLYP